MQPSEIGCPRCDGLVVSERLIEGGMRSGYHETRCLLCGWRDGGGVPWSWERRRQEIARTCERRVRDLMERSVRR